MIEKEKCEACATAEVRALEKAATIIAREAPRCGLKQGGTLFCEMRGPTAWHDALCIQYAVDVLNDEIARRKGGE